jgi:hypothetical protein
VIRGGLLRLTAAGGLASQHVAELLPALGQHEPTAMLEGDREAGAPTIHASSSLGRKKGSSDHPGSSP